MEHIFATVVVAVFCVLGGIYFWANHLVAAFVNLRTSIDALARAKSYFSNGNYADYLASASEAQDAETQLAIAGVVQQAQSNIVDVDIEGLLDDVRGRFSGLVVWPRFFAQIAVYIGLIGTIGGLWFALSNLQGATQIQDEATLRAFAQSTRELLGSLQGAFTSALAGVIVTVVLGARVQSFDKLMESYLADLDRFLSRTLVPQLEEARLGLMPQSGLEAAKLVVTQLDKTLVAFTKAWSARFNTLSSKTEQMSEASERLSDASKTISSSSDGMVRATNSLESSLADFSQQVSLASDQTNLTNANLASASSAVSQLTAKIEQWPDLGSDLRTTASEVLAASQSLKTFSLQFHEANKEVATELRELRNHVGTISQTTFDELSRTLIESIAETGRSASQEIGTLARGTQARDESLRVLVEKAALATERQADQGAKMSETMYTMINALPVLEDPRPTIEQMLKALNEVSSAIQTRAEHIAPQGTLGLETSLDSTTLLDALKQINAGIEQLNRSTVAVAEVTVAGNLKLAEIEKTLIRVSAAPNSSPNENAGPTKRSRWPWSHKGGTDA